MNLFLDYSCCSSSSLVGTPSSFPARGRWLILSVRQGASFFQLLNQGELAALYIFLFTYIAADGSGAWSLDNARCPVGKIGLKTIWKSSTDSE